MLKNSQIEILESFKNHAAQDGYLQRFENHIIYSWTWKSCYHDPPSPPIFTKMEKGEKAPLQLLKWPNEFP